MSESTFNSGLALGGLDLILIIGSDLYFSKKLTELSVKIDKIENNVKHQHVAKASSGYQENDVEADIDELYNRVESLESTIDKLSERQKRSEFLLNQIIDALKDNSINLNIEAKQRRIHSRRKQPVSQKNNRENENGENGDRENGDEDEEDNSDIDIIANMAKSSK
jgi:predicted  nucleic acid-binding Zn-ribbon protein